MRIIISDSSALIDLHKGGLLELFLKLPFEFVIPDALLESELLSFSKKEINNLRRHMVVSALNGEEVERAQQIIASVPALSMLDGFALVVVEKHLGCVLLTGDKRMRIKAEELKVECHGVLWIVAEIFRADSNNSKTLQNALKTWLEDPFVRLPHPEIMKLIESMKPVIG